MAGLICFKLTRWEVQGLCGAAACLTCWRYMLLSGKWLIEKGKFEILNAKKAIFSSSSSVGYKNFFAGLIFLKLTDWYAHGLIITAACFTFYSKTVVSDRWAKKIGWSEEDFYSSGRSNASNGTFCPSWAISSY